MREATTFSRILEMKLRFEIGRKLLRSSVGRDVFLRRGCPGENRNSNTTGLLQESYIIRSTP